MPLEDPGFALEVLTAAPGFEASMVGRVLDFLRARSSVPGTASTGVLVREAAWARRIAAEYPDRDPASVTAGDLRDLIAKWVVIIREEQQQRPRRRQDGRAAEGAAVNAFRHLCGYWVEKRWAQTNVAAELRKPPPTDPRCRPWRPEEAAVIRQFARSHGRDGLLNEVIVTIAERMGLRRDEMYRLRLCDIDLDHRIATHWGKGSKQRETPIPPVLAELLARYIEDRRPPDIPWDIWVRSDEYLLRSRPTRKYPTGNVLA